MRKILIIAGEYMPYSTPCSFRMCSFAKYLPEFGWEPTVFSVWPGSDLNANSYFGKGAVNSNYKDICRTYRFFQKPAIHFPSILKWLGYGIGFGYFAKQYYKLAKDLLKKEKFDAILATHPGSGTSLRIAIKLGEEFSIPVICDFRDLATQYRKSPPTNISLARSIKSNLSELTKFRRISKLAKYEMLYSKKATFCTAVSDGLCDMLNEYGVKASAVVYNGYNEEHYKEKLPIRPYIFHIVYAGALHYERDLSVFFEALKVIEILKPDFLNTIEVSFYGVSSETGKLFKPTRSFNINFYNRVPKEEIAKITMGADILLHLSHPNTKGIMTSKLTEYLGACRPILSIPGDGDIVDRFLDETNAGVSLGEPEEIANWIIDRIMEKNEGKAAPYYPNAGSLQKYTRKNQCRILSEHLNNLCS